MDIFIGRFNNVNNVYKIYSTVFPYDFVNKIF